MFKLVREYLGVGRVLTDSFRARVLDTWPSMVWENGTDAVLGH